MRLTITNLLLFVFINFSFLAAPSWAGDDDTSPEPAIYFSFPDAFTINFLSQSNKKARYLQIKVSLMAHNPEIISSAELNLPMLEDALRTLFSDQSFENVTSIKGRKALQTNALQTIKAILKEETGQDNLDAVYFTSFILQ
ncbi:MAG: flagellar basal body protein FliL [Methylophaga sp.]|nr:MAG: flagellar basal body protein FliL [Methylophaga sp.]